MLEMPKLEVSARIGLALLRVQAVEHVLLLLLSHVLSNSSAQWDKLQAKDEATRKQTLGFLLTELRKRAHVAEEFDAVLARFLTMRNTFIHRISDAPGWNMETEQGLQAAKAFLIELDEKADHVGKVFHALVRDWETHNGIPNTDSDHPYFEEVDASYRQLLPIFFAPRIDTH